MDLYLLAELKTISLKVTTVDMLKPPPDFRTNFEATPPPILIDNGLAVLENEKIERHIMKNVPGGHNLFVQDKDVASRIENVYSVRHNSTTTTLVASLLGRLTDRFRPIRCAEIQTDAAEEGRGVQEHAAVAADQDRRALGQARQPIPHRRHALLFRLRADAAAPAHPSGRSVALSCSPRRHIFQFNKNKLFTSPKSCFFSTEVFVSIVLLLFISMAHENNSSVAVKCIYQGTRPWLSFVYLD